MKAVSNVELGDIAEFSSGGTPSKKNDAYWDGHIPWISAKSMHDDIIDTSDNMITKLGLNNGSKLAPKGSILILVRGSMLYNRIPAGIAANAVAFNQDVKCLKLNPEYHAGFVMQQLRAKEHRLLSMVVGTGIGAGKIDTDRLKSVLFQIPSLPEQKKIADFLGAVDEKLRLLRARRESLTEYKKGVMQKIFTQSLRFKADDGSDFPDWELYKLKEISKKHSSNLQAGSLSEIGAYPVFGANGVSGYFGSYQSESAYCSIVKDGAGVGRVAYRHAKTSVVGTCDRITTKGDNSIQYLYYFLSQFNFKPYIIGSTIPHIYFKDYGQYTIKLPHPDEQQKIADFLSTIDDKISAVEAQITQMQDFKKGLLQQMFA